LGKYSHPSFSKEKKNWALECMGAHLLATQNFYAYLLCFLPFLAEANGRGMNSGLHEILMTINYIMSTTSIMVFFQSCGMEKLAKNSQKIEKLIKSTLEYDHNFKNKTPKFLLKPQILWEKKSLITMV